MLLRRSTASPTLLKGRALHGSAIRAERTWTYVFWGLSDRLIKPANHIAVFEMCICTFTRSIVAPRRAPRINRVLWLLFRNRRVVFPEQARGCFQPVYTGGWLFRTRRVVFQRRKTGRVCLFLQTPRRERGKGEIFSQTPDLRCFPEKSYHSSLSWKQSLGKEMSVDLFRNMSLGCCDASPHTTWIGSRNYCDLTRHTVGTALLLYCYLVPFIW